jgi:hypothetical protein
MSERDWCWMIAGIGIGGLIVAADPIHFDAGRALGLATWGLANLVAARILYKMRCT